MPEDISGNTTGDHLEEWAAKVFSDAPAEPKELPQPKKSPSPPSPVKTCPSCGATLFGALVTVCFKCGRNSHEAQRPADSATPRKAVAKRPVSALPPPSLQAHPNEFIYATDRLGRSVRSLKSLHEPRADPWDDTPIPTECEATCPVCKQRHWVSTLDSCAIQARSPTKICDNCLRLQQEQDAPRIEAANRRMDRRIRLTEFWRKQQDTVLAIVLGMILPIVCVLVYGGTPTEVAQAGIIGLFFGIWLAFILIAAIKRAVLWLMVQRNLSSHFHENEARTSVAMWTFGSVISLVALLIARFSR